MISQLTPPLTRTAQLAEAAGLLVLQPVHQRQRTGLLLVPGRYVLGSGAASCLELPSPSVATEHALLNVTEERITITACDQRTWVNDWPIRESRLRRGDRLTIGPFVFDLRPATADELLSQLPAAATSPSPISDRSGSANPPRATDATIHGSVVNEQHDEPTAPTPPSPITTGSMPADGVVTSTIGLAEHLTTEPDNSSVAAETLVLDCPAAPMAAAFPTADSEPAAVAESRLSEEILQPAETMMLAEPRLVSELQSSIVTSAPQPTATHESAGAGAVQQTAEPIARIALRLTSGLVPTAAVALTNGSMAVENPAESAAVSGSHTIPDWATPDLPAPAATTGSDRPAVLSERTRLAHHHAELTRWRTELLRERAQLDADRLAIQHSRDELAVRQAQLMAAGNRAGATTTTAANSSAADGHAVRQIPNDLAEQSALLEQRQLLQAQLISLQQQTDSWTQRQVVFDTRWSVLLEREADLLRLQHDTTQQLQRITDRANRLEQREQELHAEEQRLTARSADLGERQRLWNQRMSMEQSRLSELAAVARKALADEAAEQSATWQQWEAAYLRTSTELKAESERLHAQRAELLADQSAWNDRLRDLEQQRQQFTAEQLRLQDQLSELTEWNSRIAEQTSALSQREANLAAAQAALAADRERLRLQQEAFAAERQTLEELRQQWLNRAPQPEIESGSVDGSDQFGSVPPVNEAQDQGIEGSTELPPGTGQPDEGQPGSLEPSSAGEQPKPQLESTVEDQLLQHLNSLQSDLAQRRDHRETLFDNYEIRELIETPGPRRRSDDYSALQPENRFQGSDFAQPGAGALGPSPLQDTAEAEKLAAIRDLIQSAAITRPAADRPASESTDNASITHPDSSGEATSAAAIESSPELAVPTPETANNQVNAESLADHTRTDAIAVFDDELVTTPSPSGLSFVGSDEAHRDEAAANPNESTVESASTAESHPLHETDSSSANSPAAAEMSREASQSQAATEDLASSTRPVRCEAPTETDPAGVDWLSVQSKSADSCIPDFSSVSHPNVADLLDAPAAQITSELPSREEPSASDVGHGESKESSSLLTDNDSALNGNALSEWAIDLPPAALDRPDSFARDLSTVWERRVPWQSWEPLDQIQPIDVTPYDELAGALGLSTTAPKRSPGEFDSQRQSTAPAENGAASDDLLDSERLAQSGRVAVEPARTPEDVCETPQDQPVHANATACEAPLGPSDSVAEVPSPNGSAIDSLNSLPSLRRQEDQAYSNESSLPEAQRATPEAEAGQAALADLEIVRTQALSTDELALAGGIEAALPAWFVPTPPPQTGSAEPVSESNSLRSELAKMFNLPIEAMRTGGESDESGPTDNSVPIDGELHRSWSPIISTPAPDSDLGLGVSDSDVRESGDGEHRSQSSTSADDERPVTGSVSTDLAALIGQSALAGMGDDSLAANDAPIPGMWSMGLGAGQTPRQAFDLSAVGTEPPFTADSANESDQTDSVDATHDQDRNDEPFAADPADSMSTPPPAIEVPPPAPPVEKEPAEVELDADDPESISAYMERLLARTRRSSSGADEPPKASTTRRTPPPPPPMPPAPPPLVMQSVESMTGEVVIPAATNLAPRHQVDKDQLRAHLRSFREVANVSARSALKTSAWKQLKTGFYVKATLTGVLSLVTAAFMAAPLWGNDPDWMQGLICGGLTSYFGFETFRTMRQLKRWKVNAASTAEMPIISPAADHESPRAESAENAADATPVSGE